MKKLLLFCLISSIFVCAHAQITLTASSTNPIIGDVVNYTEGPSISPGSAGANQTWNLSSIQNTSTITLNFVNPSSTTAGSSFPSANIASQQTGGDAFYNGSSTAFSLHGAYEPSQPTTVIYTNPDDLLRYPFTYNNNYVDTWTASYVASGQTIYRKGTSTVTADGHGTLVLPNGTFNNALRVKFYQTYTDSMAGVGVIATTINDQYFWYLSTYRFAVASISNISINGTPSSNFSRYRTGISSIDESQLTDFSVYPNPANEIINITFSSEENQYDIQIIDISGKVIVNKTGLTSGQKQESINVSELAKGIYTLKVNSGTAVEVKKIIIQ